jgi:hypothetical protein
LAYYNWSSIWNWEDISGETYGGIMQQNILMNQQQFMFLSFLLKDKLNDVFYDNNLDYVLDFIIAPSEAAALFT